MKKVSHSSWIERRRQIRAQNLWMGASIGRLELWWSFMPKSIYKSWMGINRVWRDEFGNVSFAEQVFEFPNRRRKCM